MANRMFQQFQGTLDKGVVKIFGEFVGAGASQPTGVAGKGIASVTRAGAGLYTVTLQDAYWKVLHSQIQLTLASATPVAGAAALRAFVVAQSTLSPFTFQIRVTDASDVAADIPAGVGVDIELTLSNSSAL